MSDRVNSPDPGARSAPHPRSRWTPSGASSRAGDRPTTCSRYKARRAVAGHRRQPAAEETRTSPAGGKCSTPCTSACSAGTTGCCRRRCTVPVGWASPSSPSSTSTSISRTSTSSGGFRPSDRRRSSPRWWSWRHAWSCRSRPPPTRAVPAALEALRIGRPYSNWLLVFDNAEDPDSVEQFFPKGGPGSIVVTSRNGAWREVANSLPVDVFERQESIDLLRRRGPDLAVDDADRLAAALGDLPWPSSRQRPGAQRRACRPTNTWSSSTPAGRSSTRRAPSRTTRSSSPRHRGTCRSTGYAARTCRRSGCCRCVRLRARADRQGTPVEATRASHPSRPRSPRPQPGPPQPGDPHDRPPLAGADRPPDELLPDAPPGPTRTDQPDGSAGPGGPAARRPHAAGRQRPRPARRR